MELASLRIENINQSVTTALNIVFSIRILFGEGDEYQALDILDVERRITGRRARIRELCNQRRIRAIDINCGFGEIGCEENRAARISSQCDTFVNRIGASRQNFCIYSKGRTPAGNRAV